MRQVPHYGPDGQRYQRIDDGSGIAGKTTTYLGAVERIVDSAGTVTWRRPVAGVVLQQITGEVLSGGFTVASTGGSSYHLFFDHLGSTALWAFISGSSATVVHRFDYAPHGEPRPTGAVRLRAAPASTSVPWRGFTGHEHVDFLSIIHMNGRVYDPVLGRFLQTDPMVQAPHHPQTWNPYSYVQNNPLSLTDPTGMFSVGQFVRTVAAIAITVYTGGAAAAAGGWAGAAWAAGGGFAAGAIQSGSLKGGVYGAFSGLMFYGIGSGFQGAANANLTAGPPASQLTSAGLTAAQTASKIISHGLAGGVMDSLAGGKFGHGFASAGFVEAAGPLVGGAKTATGQVVVAAIAGGTASAMTGGKFANGAMTGAFSRALNHCAHGHCTSDGEQALYGWWPGYKAGTLIYNQTMGDGSWTGWEVFDATTVGFAGLGGLVQKTFSAGRGAHAFFSGGEDAARAAAAMGRLGYFTIFDSPAGRLVSMIPDRYRGDAIWRAASIGFAASTRSAVVSLQNPLRPGATWFWEKAILDFTRVPIRPIPPVAR